MRLELWNAVFLAGLIGYLTIRHLFGRRTKNNQKALSRVDATDWTLLVIVMAGSLLLPVLYLVTPWFAFADYRLPHIVPWSGLVLMVASLWLFWRAHADLGKNWSVTLELRQGHELITQGVYHWIRHPMYASTWLWCLAQGLMLQNWLAGWSALGTFALLYFVRVPREEQMMCEFFGQDYRDYMEETGRLFPRLNLKKNA